LPTDVRQYSRLAIERFDRPLEPIGWNRWLLDLPETSMNSTQPIASHAAGEVPVLSTAELDADPHAIFRYYRPRTPLIQRSDGSYVVIRARDAEALITDPRTRQLETEMVRARGVTSGSLFDFFDNSMLFSNSPLHRRRRAPMSRAFAFRVIEALRPRIREIANGLIDEVFAQGEMNLLDHYAATIPARLISEIVGISPADIPRFTGWAYSLTRALSFSYSADEIPRIQAATGEFGDYLNAVLAQRRADPGEDFLSSFVRAVDEQGTLSATEALMQVMTVVVGGSDTTRAALTMMVNLLLQHREQWDAVGRDSTLIPGAVLEALRYDAAVGSVPRLTLQDIELDGHLLPANKIVSLSTLSWLRDPAVYARPDTFDIRRTDHPPRHPAFGGGVHRCLGELLARAELEESLAVLIERLPSLRLVGAPPVLHGHSGVRRITAMRVGWPA
jgi:cytochrome P450